MELKLASDDEKFLFKVIEQTAYQAFLEGVEQGKKEVSFPPIITRSEFMEMYRIGETSASNHINSEGFPKTKIQGRYPTWEVIKFMKVNSPELKLQKKVI
ncbi:hypothetical protein BE882_14935 [Listeria monocytogenes]|uniref:Uncharacterized protein n=1 Tax=Listeria grayi TaxID=1641 RepID=A0A378MJA5_LISGR|nr:MULTISPECIES: hypothetical protein [Listeria]EAC4425296.1 hypothetical protein [Listeria monocytogenes]EAD5308152.1 hypothetical protein [Listeria monocytogenes]EAD5322726.1 hypothetical protein [Listeria monocytogenes]EAD5935120.1 hypothetical protein [Listeria monocytogenes]EAE0718382.1 hypothetical protein [Listeria monocytogenes]